MRALPPASPVWAAALILASCMSATEVPETILREGELQATAAAPPGLSGSAAMVATFRETQVGVDVDDGEPGSTYVWIVVNGSCSAPAAQAAAPSIFPPIVLGSTGAGSAEAIVNRRLTGTDYAVQVYRDNNGAAELIACADLIRT